LLKHYRKEGLTPRKKRSGGRKSNPKALTATDTELVVNFINSFAEAHALVLPGRIPGFKRSDIRLVPSSETKASIFRHYQNAAFAFPEG